MADEQVRGVAEARDRLRRWMTTDRLRSGYAEKLRATAHGPNGPDT
jgi:hypothetical protein